ncbi:MAG: phosphotransferase [Lachnospiraceae bacterium]|nr:phosphotransferase [Lachnospiraceae bacterium]
MQTLPNLDFTAIFSAWGLISPELLERFHPDSPRIILKVRSENHCYILKGIPAISDGRVISEQTIQGNVCAHQFLGNQKGIAPRIFSLKDGADSYYLKRDGYWFYLLEFLEGRPMQSTPADEFLLAQTARTLHTIQGYSLPSSLNENKQRFYAWFSNHPFKAAFNLLLDDLPDFSSYDRCLIHTDLGPHNALIRPDGRAALIDLDDCGIGSRYLDLGWPFIMQFVEHTEDMRLSYRFDLAEAFLKGYYPSASLSKKEYDLLWQGAIYMHISYMQSYGPDAVQPLWNILQFGLAQKPLLWKLLQTQ